MPAPRDDVTALEAMERLEGFLTRSPGLPYCAECLAHELAIHVDLVRRALVDLRSRLREERRWCARCLRWSTVVSVEPV